MAPDKARPGGTESPPLPIRRLCHSSVTWSESLTLRGMVIAQHASRASLWTLERGDSFSMTLNDRFHICVTGRRCRRFARWR